MRDETLLLLGGKREKIEWEFSLRQKYEKREERRLFERWKEEHIVCVPRVDNTSRRKRNRRFGMPFVSYSSPTSSLVSLSLSSQEEGCERNAMFFLLSRDHDDDAV